MTFVIRPHDAEIAVEQFEFVVVLRYQDRATPVPVVVRAYTEQEFHTRVQPFHAERASALGGQQAEAVEPFERFFRRSGVLHRGEVLFVDSLQFAGELLFVGDRAPCLVFA